MLKRLLIFAGAIAVTSTAALSQTTGVRTRLAVVGLDHDHVWGLLNDISKEPRAELVAIADAHPELVQHAKARVPASVKFFSDYVKMLDDEKPDAVIVTTENDKHLEILRECARRHISFSVEKPMATNTADAKEMARLAKQAGIKLMVNYWNVWVAPSHEIFHRVYRGDLGPVQKIIVEYGHQGPKEIGVSKYFADWLYDPVKNGGGAIMDFGCYGAEWALWLKGRPSRVYAYTLRLKTEQNNAVDDDAVMLLEYPDATAVLLPSWDWPYGKGQVQVFGPKGSLLATDSELLFRPAGSDAKLEGLDGKPVQLNPVEHETSNPISYLVYCIRNNKPVEPPLTPDLNVQVVEILDAAKESIRTGRAVELAP
jgi:predicted dehydrogenase